MRFTIRHQTRYVYDRPGSFSVQRLRLTPCRTDGQIVHSWSVEAPGMEHAAEYVDGFGNRTHLIGHSEPYDEITIVAAGEVETRDTGGVIGDTGELANPQIFLRETPLTRPSDAIVALARGLPQADELDKLHLLLEAIASRVRYDTDATNSGTTAADALEAESGVCQDHAHIFISAARVLGIPARYVTGYMHVQGEEAAVAHHAWAEALVRNLGWVGFDPANHVSPTERYVRLACGFDAPHAAPITGTRRGGGTEHLNVDVVVRQQQQ